jgi:hypothetical protein
MPQAFWARKACVCVCVCVCVCWMVTAFVQTNTRRWCSTKESVFVVWNVEWCWRFETVDFSEVIVHGDEVTVIFASIMPPLCCKWKLQYVHRYLLIQFVDGGNWLRVIEVPGTGFCAGVTIYFHFPLRHIGTRYEVSLVTRKTLTLTHASAALSSVV